MRNHARVKELVASQASRQEVIAHFGEPLIDYSVGASTRPYFDQMVSSYGGCDAALREPAVRYPGVLYHTTMWTMTWMFFDADGRLGAYVRCEQ
jgi:hypothetical protein